VRQAALTHFCDVSEEVVCTTMFVPRRSDGAKLLGLGPSTAAERPCWLTADLSYLANWLFFAAHARGEDAAIGFAVAIGSAS
jgi:hypothetical protein